MYLFLILHPVTLHPGPSEFARSPGAPLPPGCPVQGAHVQPPLTPLTQWSHMATPPQHTHPSWLTAHPTSCFSSPLTSGYFRLLSYLLLLFPTSKCARESRCHLWSSSFLYGGFPGWSPSVLRPKHHLRAELMPPTFLYLVHLSLSSRHTCTCARTHTCMHSHALTHTHPSPPTAHCHLDVSQTS